MRAKRRKKTGCVTSADPIDKLWVVHCITHERDTVVDTYKDADKHARRPERWCPDCRDGLPPSGAKAA